MWKPLTREDVEIEVLVEPELAPVRGNLVASGDDACDKKIEDEVTNRVKGNIMCPGWDPWAWAYVEVKVSWGMLSASDHLRCCSYKNEEDFRSPKGESCYDEMVEVTLAELNMKAKRIYEQLGAHCAKEQV